MHPTTLISLLCARPALADQLLGGTIASVRHHLDHAIGASVPITVPIIDEGAFIAVPVFIDIEDPTTAPDTFRDFENGWMNWVECDADGAITVAGVVDGQDRLRIVVVPTGDRLRITFLREAGIA
jgi:hypothetical protein